MKILIIKTVKKGLDEKITYNVQGIGLGTELVKLGHDVALVYFSEDGKYREQILNIDGGLALKIFHIPGRAVLSSAVYDSKLFQLCNEYDIIQPSEYDQFTSWLIYRKYPHKTIIYHGPYYSKFTKKHNFYVKVFDLMFLNNKYKMCPIITKSILSENYLLSKGFCNVKTLGVGFNENYVDCEKDERVPVVKDIKDFGGEDKLLLYIGAISERKNVLFLLQILYELVFVNRYKCKLVIVGKIDPNDEYYKRCIQYITEKELSNYVLFCGAVEQKYLKFIYKSADIFLLPTQYDIFGMVYLEAMYFGIPVVTSVCGGSSTLIENEETGYICQLENIEQWCKCIKKMLEDETLYRKISKKSSDLIKNHYLWSCMAINFEKEYYEVTNGSRGI